MSNDENLAARPVADGEAIEDAERAAFLRWYDEDAPHEACVLSAKAGWMARAALARQAPAPLSQAVPDGLPLAELHAELTAGYEAAATISGSALLDGSRKALKDAPVLYELACKVLRIVGYAKHTIGDALSRHPQPQAVTEDARDGEADPDFEPMRSDWPYGSAADMLTAYIELVKATGRYAEEHYIPEVQEVVRELRDAARAQTSRGDGDA